jgi:hypothetical protein
MGQDTGVRLGARQRSHFEVLTPSIAMSLVDPGPSRPVGGNRSISATFKAEVVVSGFPSS